jgi:hypothetical protein
MPKAGAAENASPKTIPWTEVGATAGAQYSGDGLKVTPTEHGARLRCVFQRLEGEATREGLWLTSSVTNSVNDRFRVVSIAVGREDATTPLPPTGKVIVAGETVRFTRPGLVEEYTVCMDGVRQDFVVADKPVGKGELQLRLNVAGARVEETAHGAQLVLDKSGRKIAYSRLRVTDANSKELPARIELANSSQSEIRNPQSEIVMVVMVNDSDAVYPVRIDPTFSDANWVSLGGINGADNAVYAAAVDGSGNLYVGGSFTVAGDVVANRIAKWNGTNWSALGAGMDYHVYALAVSGNNVYAGGNFKYVTNSGQAAVLVNRIAKWDGTTWTALGAGIGGNPGFGYGVYALAVSGGDLYAGGDFTYATNTGPTSVLVNRVAKWNGNNWSALGSGMFGVMPQTGVYALAVSSNDLYAGGAFTTAGGRAANGIAKWNGSDWRELGAGIAGPGSFPFEGTKVYALAVSGSNVYVGGQFSRAAGIPANHIAKWDGSAWITLGSGMNNRVAALVVSGNDLYVGGDFAMATNSLGEAVAVNRIAKWDGTTWTALGVGVNSNVSALVLSGSNELYAGGWFTTAGSNAANSIAKWNASNWSALNSDMNNRVSALVAFGSNVYVGGAFTTVGGIVANHIAKWNGSVWSPLGAGLNAAVSALAVSGSNVFAGGDFTTAGGNAANYIAKWNGSAWSALSSGLDNSVRALAVSGSDLYAGGNFWGAGGVVGTRGIAKWDGSVWSAVGSGIEGTVSALAVSGSDIYVGGWFHAVPANYIAKWNGSAWSALGAGLNGQVTALAISGSNVYAGGAFSVAGGSAGDYIAKWNGATWTALGSGLGRDDQFSSPFPYVYALAVVDNILYAGGDFTTAGGIAAKYIAKWDGTNWSAMGSGMNNRVSALAVSGNDVYVGGGFTTAGGNAVGYAVKTVVYPLAFDVLSISNGTFWALLTGPVSNSVVVDVSSSFIDWTPMSTNTVPAGGTLPLSFSIGTNSQHFFRARLGP